MLRHVTGTDTTVPSLFLDLGGDLRVVAFLDLGRADVELDAAYLTGTGGGGVGVVLPQLAMPVLSRAVTARHSSR